jgi:hypothetical protein
VTQIEALAPARSGRGRGHPDVVVVAVNANRPAEYVHYDHCIRRTRSFHIEERNRTIQ